MHKYIFIFLISFFFYSSSSFAKIGIHFSKVRFYLDDQVRTDSFEIKNRGNDAAACSLSLSHYQVLDNGDIKKIADGEVGAYNPANKLVRYSPRRVKILPYVPQTVRLSFRRTPKLKDGEYISFLLVECHEDLKAKRGAQLKYNLPVVIRHGQINSDNKIASAKLIKNNGINSVEIIHERLPESTSSIIGSYEVIGKESGDVYATVNDMKIYAPAKFKKITLSFTEDVTEPLQIKFTMEPKLGNEVVVKDITN